jgi:hypothetical protein
MQSIIFLGPDRVGKTSLIQNTAAYLRTKLDYEVGVMHFTGVKPWHHSPVDQFREQLMGVESPGPHFLLLDRFVSDTLYYEEARKQMPHIDPACAQEPESLLLEMSSRVDVVILQQGWTQEIIDRHIYELRNTNPKATTYWINAQLELRMEEHYEYYKHTTAYFKTSSLLTNTHNIHTILNTHLFTMCPEIPIPDR